MSSIYSGLYLITNILAPLSFMVFNEMKVYLEFNKNEENCTKNDKTQHTSKSESQSFQVNYGKWTMFIISIFFFNFLFAIFPKSLIIILLGLIVKTTIIKCPQTLNHAIQEIIQKLHLEVYSQIIIVKIIDLYLDMTQKLNFYIVFYQIEEKDDKIQVLNRMKDNVSRIQLELQENQQVKNKSFIVASKKMQKISINVKSYQNIGVNCDILKGSQIGKEILKILQEKTLLRQKSPGPKIQQPTKDQVIENKKITKSGTYTPKSESLQQKIRKIKSNANIPTSQKKSAFNFQLEQQSQFTIKRSQTFDIDELQFQDSPISKKRQNNHIIQSPVRIKKNMTRKVEYAEQMTVNSQNMGVIDIATSQKSLNNQNGGTLKGIIDSLEQGNQGSRYQQTRAKQISSGKIFPPEINISSIDQQTIHPFKVNLSSLTNPLIISGQNQRSKILPNSLFTSQQTPIIESRSNKPITSSITDPSKKEHLPNVSQVQTEIMMQQFSQQSSIPNKVEVSISQSQYSDMFESQGQEEEPKLQIKVEAVVQNSNSSKSIKPRLDICNIALYDNKDIKFYSVYDHLLFEGKIMKMTKKPENFYEIVCLQKKKIQDGKQVQAADQNMEKIKKVKFRGQAKPFMKYLETSKQ